jgi:hypothetical protein
MADRLTGNQQLGRNQGLTSSDGRFTLVMQGDGNLVLYGPGGRARWDTGTWGKQVDHAVMQAADGNLVLYAPGGGAVWASNTAGNPGASLVVQDDGNLVIYRANGTAAWASNTAIVRRQVGNFLPSASGFDFPNRFDQVPHFTIDFGTYKVPIGNAANGLCGGMVYAARDYFQAALPPPENPGSPTLGPSSGPLYDHLVRRLYMSFELPYGPWVYMNLMSPALPDHETDLSRAGLAPHGRAWVMINEAWPAIRADIDAGRLSPMALVTIKSADAFKLGENHQVLAYGYELDGDDLRIRVYDPNSPNDDRVAITLNIHDPQHTTPVGYTGTVYRGDKQIWCFFRTGYTYMPPPGAVVAGPHWRPWDSLGGVVTSGPDVCSWAPGRLDVFVRGTDNALYHRWYDGNWSGWESLGGVITSDPAAVSWASGRIDVFARGTDNALWHKWYAGGWSDWESLGGVLAGGPDVSSWAPGRLDVFVLGTDAALHHRWYDGNWSGWESLGGVLTSDPTAVSWGQGRIDVFARGEGNVLSHRWYEGAWSGWETLNGGVVADGPDVCSWAAGRLDLFTRGFDGALWHRWYAGGWSGWESLGGVLTTGPSAVSWGQDRIDVFGRFTDDALWHKWYG